MQRLRHGVCVQRGDAMAGREGKVIYFSLGLYRGLFLTGGVRFNIAKTKDIRQPQPTTPFTLTSVKEVFCAVLQSRRFPSAAVA